MDPIKMTTFDLRETIIPFSLLQICNHFKRMKPGEVLEVLCCDAAIEKDLRCILSGLTCEIVVSEMPGRGRGEFILRLRKIGRNGEQDERRGAE